MDDDATLIYAKFSTAISVFQKGSAKDQFGCIGLKSC